MALNLLQESSLDATLLERQAKAKLLRHTTGVNGLRFENVATMLQDTNPKLCEFPMLSLELVQNDEIIIPKPGELYFDADCCTVYLGSHEMDIVCSNASGFNCDKRFVRLRKPDDKRKWLEDSLNLGYMREHLRERRALRTHAVETLLGCDELPSNPISQRDLLQRLFRLPKNRNKNWNEIIADCPSASVLLVFEP